MRLIPKPGQSSVFILAPDHADALEPQLTEEVYDTPTLAGWQPATMPIQRPTRNAADLLTLLAVSLAASAATWLLTL